MSTGLKIFLWILAIIVVLAVLGFAWGKGVWDKINFSTPILQGLDLNGIKLEDLSNIALLGQTKTVTATIAIGINNDNNFSIPFSSINVQLLYKDTVIAETNDPNSYTLPANGSLSLSNKVNIILNNAGGNLLIDKIKGGHPKIDYVVNLKVFGIPIPSIKNNLTW